MRSSRYSVRVFIAGALLPVAAGTGLLVAASTGGATDPKPGADRDVTQSTLGNGQTVDTMSPNMSERPDFVPALGRDGKQVGYVRTREIEPVGPDGQLLLPEPTINVYGEDGKTVVGQMLADVGFVSSEDLQKGNIPDKFPVSTSQGRAGE